MNRATDNAFADNAANALQVAIATPKPSTWAQIEGTPLPLGATWIEEERAFNFAVYSEHAESVTLLMYSASDLANPVLTYPFDFTHNKSGRIWHCRIPLHQMGDARYYAYSVSGQASAGLNRFHPDKVLLDPMQKVPHHLAILQPLSCGRGAKRPLPRLW